MTVEEIRESLLPWQRDVFDRVMDAPPGTLVVTMRHRRAGWRHLSAAIDEARRIIDQGASR